MNSIALMDPPHPASKPKISKQQGTCPHPKLCELPSEALVYVFMAQSVSLQDRVDAAARMAEVMVYACPTIDPEILQDCSRRWVDTGEVTANEVMLAAKSLAAQDVSRVLTSALYVTLQGHCATARSMYLLTQIQRAMPKPEYVRGEIRAVA
jgi:hypothetical protein